MRVPVGIVALSLSQIAWAYESEPVPLVFYDEVDVFEEVETTTGWLPAGSPVATQFFIRSEGAAITKMDATSELTWPESLTHRITGVPGSGVFTLLTDIDIVAEVQVDIFGYQGTWEVWSTGVEMSETALFDPMLLVGDDPTSVSVESDGNGIQPANVDIGVFPGVGLNFAAEIFPQSQAHIEGLRIETDEQEMNVNGQAILLDIPADDPSQVALESTYVSWLDASLDIVLQPSMSFCVDIAGCFEVASFDIPLSLADVDGEHAFEPLAYAHPLPALQMEIVTYDFGNVRLGEQVTLELPIENIGQMDLFGDIFIEGGEEFGVFPGTLYAAPTGADGVVVSFQPIVEGPISAILVLETNDPSNPRVEIPIAGAGIVPGSSGDGEEMIKSCGCALTPSAPALWLSLLGLGVTVLARRRRSAAV